MILNIKKFDLNKINKGLVLLLTDDLNINEELLIKVLPTHYNPYTFNSFPYINKDNNDFEINEKIKISYNKDEIEINSNIINEYNNLCIKISKICNPNNYLIILYDYFDKLRTHYMKKINNI